MSHPDSPNSEKVSAKLAEKQTVNNLIRSILSRENLLAIAIALLLIAIYIVTASDAPLWVYQGF